ncbi:MAG: hypothetical protein NC084_10405 [Bacteroides sp.]|nr:hypothetical protein [Eubacterium sp.]MCM1418995.1 hypothetical protein [Roseburia sp.]MCM1463111.1 hypothetical protein [Bacteroides sp.]
MREKLEAIYEKYGGKAFYPPLFLLFFFLHTISSLGMAYPATDPNELSVIAIGEWLLGRSWSGVMCSVDYYYGFLQGFLYAPALLLFRDAESCYAAMLATNALLISFVPLLAFSSARRLGVGKVWKCALIALVAGGYCCYLAHTKFAWSETVTIVYPWLLLWLLLRGDEVKNRVARGFFAILFGFLSALSLGAHLRLIAVVLAVFAALGAQKLFFKKTAVPLLPFCLSFLVAGALVMILSTILQNSLWLCSDASLLQNTAVNFLDRIAAGFTAENGVGRFFVTLFGQLYYFVTATWGVGAIALCLFGAILTRCIKRKRAGEALGCDGGTIGFLFYVFFAVALTVLFGVFYRFDSESMTAYQDTALFGRFLDGVIPLALALVLVVLFTRSIELNKLFAASGLLAVVYLAFFAFTLPTVLTGGATRIAPILALYPLRIGADSGTLLSFEGLLLTASVTFCVMALLIVVISCTKRLRSPLVSLILAAITIYSVLFIQNEYLPLCREESTRKNAAVVDLSESVYDRDGAPTLTAFNLSRHEALMLQFLNRSVTVRITYDIESIPENCYLAVRADEDVSALVNGRRPFLLVAENSELRLYAYGERAIAYMRSQNVAENEDESGALLSEKATTTAPETSPIVPETTTEPRPALTSTERTPMISTYTTPSVVTVPIEAFGTDDDWAVIE